MSRRRGNVLQLRAQPGGDPEARAVPPSFVEPAAVGLVAVRLLAVETSESARTARLDVGGAEVTAAVDGAVDVAVLDTALRRGERVIAQRDASGWIVLGTLRTQGTPGVDLLEEIALRADRVDIEATSRLRLKSGLVRFVIEASGHAETVAETITSHARGVQKIVGRLLRLN